MGDKKFTPKEAAIAVLKKAEELYKASALAKAECKHGHSTIVGKSEDGMNPDAQADAALGEKVEQDVQQHEAKNQDPAHEAPMKGHIKLAKFVGRMEHKKSLKKEDAQAMAPNMAAPEMDSQDPMGKKE